MRPKNIGFSKKHATLLAKTCCTSEVDSYAQKEEHFNSPTYQWVVVLQKKPRKRKKPKPDYECPVCGNEGGCPNGHGEGN